MAVQTWVARFVVDHGQVTEEGARLRSFQRRRLDEPDADLHVLVEPQGPHSDELGAQAIDAVGRLFVRDNLSLTGGLVRALKSTHQTLVDWNRRSVAKEQVGLGLSAAITRGATVYVAQVGPGLVYKKTGGRLEPLVPEEEALEPVGIGELEPAVRRLDLVPGDLLLAASPALAERLPPAALASLLERGSEEALPEIYLLTKDLPAFALFAITCFDDGTEAPAEAIDDAATSEGEGPAADASHGDPVLTFEVPAEPEPAPLLVAPDRKSVV